MFMSCPFFLRLPGDWVAVRYPPTAASVNRKALALRLSCRMVNGPAAMVNAQLTLEVSIESTGWRRRTDKEKLSFAKNSTRFGLDLSLIMTRASRMTSR
jgi:hypothetical protein